MKRALSGAAACVVLTCSSAAVKSEPIDGGMIVRITDPLASRCISAQDDAVTFQLVRAIERRQWNWFKSDKSVGLYIETTLSGSTGTDNKKITFPRAFMIDVQDYGPGMVSLPVEKTLLSKFRLKNGDSLYSNAEFSIKLVKNRGDEAAGIALKVLADSTKDLPIPANPFTTGFDFFVGVTNKFVDKYFEEKLSDQNSAPRAEFPIEFTTNGDCSAGGATTGAIAVIFASNEPHAVSMGQEENYCFRYKTAPTQRLEYATKTAGLCASDDASFKIVPNSYYLFVLGAVQSQVTAAAPSSRYVYFDRSYTWPGQDSTVIYDLAKGAKPIADAWAGLTPSNQTIDTSKLAARIEKYSTTAPSDYKSVFEIKTTWPAAASDNILAEIAGASGVSDAKTEIGKQSISGFDAVSQDLAVASQRCKYFGISETDCF
jgi:hypothetical protein